MSIETSIGGMTSREVENELESIRRMERLDDEPVVIPLEKLPESAEPVVAYADEEQGVDWQVWQLRDGTIVKTVINYEKEQ